VDGQSFTVEVGLLIISIHLIGAILSQGIELPGILEHVVVPLFVVQELIQLAAEQTYR
jgi:hypothetical protein